MIKLWSELPVARLKEQVADLATIVWVVFWGSIVWQLFQFLASFAGAGRAIRDGGETMIRSGRDLGESLAGLPLVGSQARDIARDAFAQGGRPLSDFGTELEQFIVVVSVVLATAAGAGDPRAVARPVPAVALGAAASGPRRTPGHPDASGCR